MTFKRKAAAALAAIATLAACQPTTYDGTPGVGFEDYESYEAARTRREAELSGGAPVIPGAGATAAPSPAVISSEELGRAGLPSGQGTGDFGAAAPAGAGFGGPQAAAAPVVVDTNNPGISDEQDFQAVSSRESIESDRERLEAQRDAYEVIRPTALPTRSGSGKPNIVAYALQTTNRVGEPIYSRSGFNSDNKFKRACAAYSSSDLAQEDFLASGGPERDRKGMDPDGDGFACYWDPSPFRAARG